MSTAMPCFPPRARLALTAPLAAFALSSCERAPAPVVAAPSHALAAVPAQPDDLFERTAHAIVGITYPPGLARYPGLVQRLVAHANARRAALNARLARTPAPPVPLELSLRFVIVADTPRLFAVSAEEELYLGGSTSRPGSTTFLWLPSEQRLLSPDEIITDPATWAQVHDYVRARRQEARMDEAGPTRAMRHDFAPRVNSAGRIVGLRFRTEDGMEVEVPAAMLKPRVAAEYAAWFDDAPTG
ncbi:MAG TPA: hypothetical protein VGD42_17890 [Lysobacter sp.]